MYHTIIDVSLLTKADAKGSLKVREGGEELNFERESGMQSV